MDRKCMWKRDLRRIEEESRGGEHDQITSKINKLYFLIIVTFRLDREKYCIGQAGLRLP